MSATDMSTMCLDEQYLLYCMHEITCIASAVSMVMLPVDIHVENALCNDGNCVVANREY